MGNALLRSPLARLSRRMREALWAIFNLAGAVIVTAIAILYGSELGLWRIALWIAAAAFVASAIGLLVHSLIKRRNEVMTSAPAKRSLEYLSQRDSSLGPPIISMAWHSAWGRWFAAQHLANNGTPIGQRYLMHTAASVVMDKILDGDLEVRGRRPPLLDYEGIPRTDWRSSAFYISEDPISLWKLHICPRGVVQIEPDGTFHASDAIAAERNSQLAGYDSLIVDAYQFERLWPKTNSIADKKRQEFLKQARRRGLDKDEIRRLS